MVTADFRPEAEFTLFLCMCTKQIAKSPGKYIPIEEFSPYYRKWTSLERMAGSDFFYQKLLNCCFCTCAVKICTKLTYIVVKSPQFYPLHKKSLLLNTMVTAVSDRKQNLRYFCACALKKSPKRGENVFRQKRYYAVTENPGRWSEWRGQTFDQKLLNSHFYACEVKMCPKLAYPVVKSPTS